MKKKINVRSHWNQMRRNEDGEIVQSILIIVMFLMIAFTMFAMVTSVIKNNNNESAPASTPVSEPVSPEVMQETTSSFPMGMVVLGLLAALLLGVFIAGSVIVSKRFSKSKLITSANLAGWQALVDHHTKIRSEWMSYETDILKIINFPLLTDMSEPATIKLHQALRNAVMHEPKDIKSMRSIPFENSSYNTAVAELDAAFRAAESKARLGSWNKFTMEEKKRLQRAKDLLAMAMNGASTPAERQMAYKQAIKTLQGLIEIPKATVLALESNAQLALTA